MSQSNLIKDTHLQLDVLAGLQSAPLPFEPGEPHFWTDPHIAQQMLQVHLDPTTELASRNPALITQIVDWLVAQCGLKSGDALLDLGCGPGLYCARFAARGLRVTGVDFSANSVAYARSQDPVSTYLVQNYVDLDVQGPFDAVTLIYGDFCVLNDADRDRLLGHIRRALKSGGWFAFDVTTRREHTNSSESWAVYPNGGFWKPGAHAVLERHFDYPDADLTVDQYAVIEADGTLSVYRNWFHDYDAASITAVLAAQGFTVRGLYGDLAGAPLADDSRWIAVLAQAAV